MAKRLKRGGGQQFVSLDFDGAESELSQGRADEQSIDDYFYQEWLRHLFSTAVESLQSHLTRQDKEIHFTGFRGKPGRLHYERTAHGVVVVDR